MAIRREPGARLINTNSNESQVQIFGKNAKTKSSKTTTDQENSVPE